MSSETVGKNHLTSCATACELSIRRATKTDLDFLVNLELECFAVHRRSSRRSLLNSIQSHHQWVHIVEVQSPGSCHKIPTAASIVLLHKRTLRLYSIAVTRAYRGMGIGDALIEHLADSAERNSFKKITLEVDACDSALGNWYRKHGFKATRILENYYAAGESAHKMTYKVKSNHDSEGRFIIVVDDVKVGVKEIAEISDIPVFSAQDYLFESRFSNASHYHVLNFCNCIKTHSMGYYISLLASARNQRVTPTVMTMKDITNLSIAQSLLDEIRDVLLEKITVQNGQFEITVILGRTLRPQFSDLGRRLFALFEMPFFTLILEKNGAWRVRKLCIHNLRHVLKQWPDTLKDALSAYRQKKRYKRTKLRGFKYDLAILVNEKEKMPPSCAQALKQFQRAAENVGFFVEFITKADRHRICEFDALFIRETTALSNHTYPMARHAYTEGLVVIDDPWSILLCSNKIYLHEKLAKAGIPQPKGWLLTKKNMTRSFMAALRFPLVLKLPESSFSMGVFRVDSIEEFDLVSKRLLAVSDLVIAQEFLDSKYDWRIGIMDNCPLFACKYHMAHDHWQIYNWDSAESEQFTGQHETVPIDQVPPHILKTALKASSLIGDGLYGVDLKDVGGKAYVIEVNDNPNIDAGIEDALSGTALYLSIMTSIITRIDGNRQKIRYLC